MILQRRGEGTPLALLHGLYGQATNFATVQSRLAHGRRVIALDLRNHGSSPHAPTMCYPAMAEDVLETLRELAALPCALVGHSMGGKVAMRAALERRPRSPACWPPTSRRSPTTTPNSMAAMSRRCGR